MAGERVRGGAQGARDRFWQVMSASSWLAGLLQMIAECAVRACIAIDLAGCACCGLVGSGRLDRD